MGTDQSLSMEASRRGRSNIVGAKGCRSWNLGQFTRFLHKLTQWPNRPLLKPNQQFPRNLYTDSMATRSRRAAATAAEAAEAEDAAPEPAAQRPEISSDKDSKVDPPAMDSGDGKVEGEGGGGMSERQVARVLLAVNVLSCVAFIGCFARASPTNTPHDCCEQ